MASIDFYREGVEKLLYQFGQKGLKPTDEYIEEGKHLGQQVFLMLQKYSKRYTVAEVRFAGSIGKKTDVVQPDLDLVIVVNNCTPPFDDVLEDFHDLLLLYQDTLKISKNSIEKKTRFSIQFTFTNGIEVDLLPAANMKPEEIYEILRNSPKDYYSYSSSLVGKQLAFMTSHSSSFVHIVIRLAKFWLKSLSFGDKKFNGGSTIMELIGIAAAEKEEKFNEKPSVLRALNDVISIVCKLDTLKLAFKEVSDNKWERVTITQRAQLDLVPGVVGTADILRRNYFIIEPANPYNNMLEDKSEVLDKIKGFARVTQERLSKLMKGSVEYATLDGNTNVLTIDVVKLFDPQPASLKAAFPSGVPNDFQISYMKPYSSLNCDMKVRNQEPMKRKEVQLAVENMKRNLFTVVNATTRGSTGNITTRDVKQAVHNLIKQNLETALMDADRDREDEFDLTLSVPYQIDEKTYAVKFSMSWK